MAWVSEAITPSVEVHCHCLPGVDDGPGDWGESLLLCRLMRFQGIRVIVATPHQLGRYEGRNSPEQIRAVVRELNGRLSAEAVDVEVLPGGDVRIDERLPALLEEDRVLTVGDARRHVLIELTPDIAVEPLAVFESLLDRGVVPIVTHPERVGWLRGMPDRLRGWLEAGAGMQLTAGAFLGEFGAAAGEQAWTWARCPGLVMVSSDAHGCAERRPRLGEAAEAILNRLGLETAHRLCVGGPGGVVPVNRVLRR